MNVSNDGLVGYDDALTQRRSRVQFPVVVHVLIRFFALQRDNGQHDVVVAIIFQPWVLLLQYR
jgi:hypothetical protein